MDVGGDKLVKPMATQLAADIGKSTNWTVVILAVTGAVFVWAMYRTWRWRRRHRRQDARELADTSEASTTRAAVGSVPMDTPDQTIK